MTSKIRNAFSNRNTKTINDGLEGIAKIIEIALHESPAEARRIARLWDIDRKSSVSSWNQFAEMPLEKALSKGSNIRFKNLDRLMNFLKEKDRGIVLTTIHMGEFFQCLFYLVCLIGSRKVSIIRRVDESEIETKIFSKLREAGLVVDVIRLSDKLSTIKLIRNLRKGGIVIAAYDLSKKFGKTAEIEFLHHKVGWVQGPIYLAAKACCYLVPFVVFKNESGRSQCDLMPVISFSANKMKSERQDITQELGRTAERYIRRYPEQWLQWPSFPEMLDLTSE